MSRNPGFCPRWSGRPNHRCSQCLLAYTQILLKRRANPQAADIWAMGVLLWTLVGGGFPFLHPAEEGLDRAARLRVMAPRIICGTPRPLPQVGVHPRSIANKRVAVPQICCSLSNATPGCVQDATSSHFAPQLLAL